MVDQPKRRQEASQRVQDLINQHYSQTVIGNRLLEIYSDVLQG
jgi:hypothetical protein